MTRFLLMVSVVACGLAAAPLQTGSLAGQVVDDDGRAIARAVVTATMIAATAGGSESVSDERGRFVMIGLPAGRYTLRAARSGFLESVHGASSPGHPGKPIVIEPGRAAEDVRLVMTRGAAISGVVRDARGEPLPEVQVAGMLTRRRADGRRMPVTAPGVTTTMSDDRGRFRLYGLSAGDYIVVAVRPSPPRRVTTAADIEAALSDRPAPPGTFLGYLPTFYPAATSYESAGIVTIKAAEDRTGIDVAVESAPVVRVAGRVSPLGTSAPVRLALVPAGLDETATSFRTTFHASSTPEGTFAFDAVLPGRYVLEAIASGARGEVAGWNRIDVTIEGANIPALEVPLLPGAIVSGRVLFDGASPRPDLRNVRVALEPLRKPSGLAAGETGARCDALGGFQLPAVTGGKYRITASAPAAPRVPSAAWSVRAVLVGGQDTAESGVELGGGLDPAEVVVVFTDRAGQISGAVEDASGEPVGDATVIAFSTNRQLWTPQSRRIVPVRTGADGRFRFSSLPAGEYFLSAVTDVDRDEWYEPAYLDSIVPGATRVAVGEGQQSMQFLRIRN